MSYEDWRTAAVLREYDEAVRGLVKRYRRGLPTVVLLPGGMGSELDQSESTYRRGEPPPQDFETVWADIGILFNGDGLKLEIDGQGRDLGQHAIVPVGALDFFANAYDGTRRYFNDLGWNFVVFAYDWRRPLTEAAAFLQEFLRRLRRATLRKHNEDPLPRTTLLAHSQGGLVAQLLLHQLIDVGSWLDKVITVGTPFYGTWSHQRRYFVGERRLSQIYGAREVARIIGSLPGPYGLMFLAHDLFLRDGEKIGLTRYPIVDAETDEPCDPYDPSNRDRYPSWVSHRHLADARAVLRTIAQPLHEPVQARLYNIRSTLDDETPTTLRWSRLSGFDPDDDASPVQPRSRDGGDGTVPGWAAWLAELPGDHQIDLKTAKDHSSLVEHVEVLEIVQSLIAQGSVPTVRTVEDELYGGTPATASADEVDRFVRDVRENRATRDDPRAVDPAMWRGIYRELKR